MKLHTIIGLFISAGLVLTGGAGVIVGYFYNKQHQTIYSDGVAVDKDVYLTMLPGQSKDFRVEVDLAWSSDVNASIWFTDTDQYVDKYISFSAKKGEELLYVDEEGNNVHEVKDHLKDNPLKERTFVGKDDKDFIVTFYLSNNMVEEELDMKFTFHMKFVKVVQFMAEEKTEVKKEKKEHSKAYKIVNIILDVLFVAFAAFAISAIIFRNTTSNSKDGRSLNGNQLRTIETGSMAENNHIDPETYKTYEIKTLPVNTLINIKVL